MIATSCIQESGPSHATAVQDLPSGTQVAVRLAWLRTHDYKPIPESVYAGGFKDLPEETQQYLKRLIKTGDKDFSQFDAETQSALLDFVGCTVVGDLPKLAQDVVRKAFEAASAPIDLSMRFEQLPADAQSSLRKYVMTHKAFEELPADCQVALLDFLTHDNQSEQLSDTGAGLVMLKMVQQVHNLCEGRTPLDEVDDLLGWVFADDSKDDMPLSFASCARFVAQHIDSPIDYCGPLDVEDFRDRLRFQVRKWIAASLSKYPAWIRSELLANPEWFIRNLRADPQWLNKFQKSHNVQGDMFLSQQAA